jgi:hypothetical protein
MGENAVKEFFDWTRKYRKPLGYIIGGLNLAAGVSQFARADYGFAILSCAIATFLIFDAYTFKDTP